MVAPLVIRRRYAAPPADVWRAWTVPGEVARWYCPNPALETRALIDLQPGGVHQVHMGDAFTLRGRYSEVRPQELLAHTWAFDDGHETRLVVELAPGLDGGTDLVLTHEDFEDAEERDGIEQGWTLTLDRLDRLLAGS